MRRWDRWIHRIDEEYHWSRLIMLSERCRLSSEWDDEIRWIHRTNEECHWSRLTTRYNSKSVDHRMNEAVTNLYINDWWSETEVLDDLFYNSTQCRVIKETIDSESMMKLFAAVKQKWFSIKSQFRLNCEYIYYIYLHKSNSFWRFLESNFALKVALRCQALSLSDWVYEVSEWGKSEFLRETQEMKNRNRKKTVYLSLCFSPDYCVIDDNDVMMMMR